MDAREQAAIDSGRALGQTCRETIGSDAEVTWAMLGWEGPNPTKRVVALASVLLPLVLLLVLPPLVALGITVAYGIAVALATSRIWTTRIVAVTPDGALVLERAGQDRPGAVVGEATLLPAKGEKEMWRAYDLHGSTVWVASTSVDAHEASLTVASAAS